MVTITLQRMAERARGHFEHAKRADGDDYWRKRDGAPDWLDDLCHEAHRYGAGDWDVMLPNDERYEMIISALDALSKHDDTDAAIDSLEPDIYTHGLHAWLASSNLRSSYVEDARSEGLCGGTNVDTDIAMGQLMEMREVFSSVRDSLDARIDDEETLEETRREYLPLIFRVPAR